MRKLYAAHSCGTLIPLLALLFVDYIAFCHITDDIVVLHISTETEVFAFTLSYTLTWYYLYKQHQNICAYYCWIKGVIKDLFK